MCLAVPARIIRIDGKEAVAEIGGVERRVSLTLTPDAQVGDYVLLHTGFAISIVDEQEARESLKLFREMGLLDPEAGEGDGL